jgi:hypothetical protein
VKIGAGIDKLRIASAIEANAAIIHFMIILPKCPMPQEYNAQANQDTSKFKDTGG